METQCPCRRCPGIISLVWRGSKRMVCEQCARRIDEIAFGVRITDSVPPPPIKEACDCGGSLAHESYCSSLG
jgi:hypothetical protein